MTSLTIAGNGIRTDEEGRFCLNDLHRASGGESRHRPSYWLDLEQTKALAAEIELAGKPAIWKKSKVGTFVAREMVYAFAMWISPAFNLQVIRSFDALQSNAPQDQSLQAALLDPRLLRDLLLGQTNQVIALQGEVEQLRPRAAALDRLTTSGKALSLTAAAKALQVRPIQFMDWMATVGWIYRGGGFGDWQAHQRRIDSGHLLHAMVEIDRRGVIELKAQVKVTPKGLARLAELLQMPNAPPLAA